MKITLTNDSETAECETAECEMCGKHLVDGRELEMIEGREVCGTCRMDIADFRQTHPGAGPQ